MPRTVQVCPQPSQAVDKVEYQMRKDPNVGGDDLNKTTSTFSETHFLVWKPLIYSIRIFGVVLLNPKKRGWSMVMTIYATLVLITIWANVIRLFFMYINNEHGNFFFREITFHTWCSYNAVCFTTLYNTGYRNKKFHEFLLKWSRGLQNNPACRHSGNHVQQMRRRVLGCVSVSWIAFIIHAAVYVYCLLNTNTFDFSLVPLSPTSAFYSVIRIVLILTQFYLNTAWIFSLCLFCLLSQAISLQFRDFQKDFRKAIEAETEILDLEIFRRRHQEIYHLVENADDVLSVFTSTSLVTNTCCGMMVLYDIVWLREILSLNTVMYTLTCVWLAVTLLILSVISHGGGYVNHLAHSPLKVIYDIRLKEVSTKMSVQITMFLSKLTGESIGLTVMGLFVINKPTILTLAATFITYFIVLVQFQDSSSTTVPPTCNSTGSAFNCP